jgi:SP family galactose:H+ symporter-like MFS transporter
MKEYETSYVIRIAFFAAIAGLLFGFDTAIISGALKFIVKDLQIEETNILLQEYIVSSVPLGALLGATFSKLSSSLVGRKFSILITAILFSIGTLIAVIGSSVYTLIFGRFLMGLGVGLSSMIVPMYLSEISPSSIRGRLVFCYQLAVTIGLLCAFLTNYIFCTSENWRHMFLVGLFPSLLLLIGTFILPESPRLLVMKHKYNDARKVLARITGNPSLVEKQLKEIKSVNSSQSSIRQIFMKPITPITMLCVLIFAFQQLSGINVIMYYSPTIYQEAGFNKINEQLLASLLNGLVFVFATAVSTWIVDKVGRRKLFFTGCLGMLICLTLLGSIYSQVFNQYNIEYKMVLAIAAILGHIIFFAISLGPLPYLIMSELFPLKMKDSGMALASCSNWGFNVVVSVSFLSLINTFTISYTFYFYAFCIFIGIIFGFFFMPETKGVSLEQIEKNIFANKKTRLVGRNT